MLKGLEGVVNNLIQQPVKKSNLLRRKIVILKSPL